MANLPRLLGEIIISTAVDITFNASLQTLAAGTYYLDSTDDSLLGVIVNMMTAAGVASPTAVCSDTSDTASTGKTTLTSSGAFTVTWSSDTTVRDILGYTGNLSSATSHVSTNHAKFLHLPTVGRALVTSPESVTNVTSYGAQTAHLAFTQSRSGKTRCHGFGTNTGIDSMAFANEIGNKVWIAHESVTNESAQKFWQDSIGKGRALRYHPDRNEPDSYYDYRIVDGGDFRPIEGEGRPNSVDSLWSWRFDVIAKVT